MAHHGHRKVDGFDAAQHVWHQIASIKARRILTKGHLVICGPVDVVENGGRQPPLCQASEVVKVMTVAQAHVVAHPGFAALLRPVAGNWSALVLLCCLGMPSHLYRPRQAI